MVDKLYVVFGLFIVIKAWEVLRWILVGRVVWVPEFVGWVIGKFLISGSVFGETLGG